MSALDFMLVPVHNKYNEIVARVLVSPCDYKKVSAYKWQLMAGYAFNKQVGLMHRFILDLDFGDKVWGDHRDGDIWDNRRSNLRYCTRSENNRNACLRSDSTSGAKGVCWYKSRNKYRVKIEVSGKRIYLGYFDDLIDAAKAYNKAAKHYHGDFAKLNNIKELRGSNAKSYTE